MSAPDRKPSSVLLAKFELVGLATSNPEVSAADLAVLWQLCSRYNEEAGAAWPSLTRLATDTRRNRMTVQRSLGNLMRLQFVALLEHGTRTTSNRYRPAFELTEEVGASTRLHGPLAPPGTAAGTLPQVGASTRPQVGASAREGRRVDASKVGAPTRPEPIYEPGYEAGVHSGGPVTACAAPGAGAGASPGAAPGPASGLRYPQFWAVYPKRTRAFEAEQIIDALLLEGVSLPMLVAGATAFAKWLDAQAWAAGPDRDKYTAGPVNWLQQRRWQDDWTVQPRAPKQERAGTKSAGSKPPAPSNVPGKAPHGPQEPRSEDGAASMQARPAGPVQPLRAVPDWRTDQTIRERLQRRDWPEWLRKLNSLQIRRASGNVRKDEFDALQERLTAECGAQLMAAIQNRHQIEPSKILHGVPAERAARAEAIVLEMDSVIAARLERTRAGLDRRGNGGPALGTRTGTRT